MHEARKTEPITAAESPLLDLRLAWDIGSLGQEAGSRRSRRRWEPRSAILVSLGISLALWAVILALIL
jgi:hypothetical protein